MSEYNIYVEAEVASVCKVDADSVQGFYFEEGSSAEDYALELRNLLRAAGLDAEIVEG